MTVSNKQRVRAEDLYHFQQISGCAMSPDGKQVAFCLHWVERETEKKYADIWLVPTDGGEARPLTQGNWRDSQPQWSGNGRFLAFLSNRTDGKQSQLCITDPESGKVRCVTNLIGSFKSFQWSPDGTRFVCAFRKKDKTVLEREADETQKKLGIVARHITRIHYKADGTGYLPQERIHVWTVDANTGEAQQLTNGDVYAEVEPVWSPDGQEILFLSNRSQEPDFFPAAIDLYIMAANGEPSTWRKVETPSGKKEKPVFSPDGQWIAYYGRTGEWDTWKNMQLWIVPTDGTAPARSLTGHIDRHLGNVSLNDLGGAKMMPPCWSSDGRQIYFQITHHGSTTLHAVSIAEKEPTLQTVIGEGGVVGAYSFDRKQSKLAYFYADFTNPGRLWIHDLAGDEPQSLTHFNEAWLEDIELGEIEEVWCKGAEANDMHGWVLKPPGFDPTQTYPSILEIHGGPLTQYANCFMHEFYYLAAHGYVIYFCNPRGGRGYGETHAKAILNNMGGPEYADLLAWVDVVRQRPYIDPQRMGVTGGSYGGYMTNFLIGRTNRFQAAVTQRSISNRISDFGTKFSNWTRKFAFDGQAPWENVESHWQQSPLKDIGGATTPTLIIHSEQDMNCNLEQGEQLYVALKMLGVDTEMVIFPDESHGLSRNGRTDRRVARLQHMLRWFDKYLK